MYLRRRSRYRKVVVITIYWPKYMGDKRQRRYLRIFDQELDDIHRAFIAYSHEENWVSLDAADVLKDFREAVQEYDGQDVLFIVAYSGHGTVEDEQLWATFRGHRKISLTDIQCHARDTCAGDFLFVINTCFGSFFPGNKARPRSARASMHLLEILAAGDRRVDLRNSFVHRLIKNIKGKEGAKYGHSVRARFAAMWNEQNEAPGVLKSIGCGIGSIELIERSDETEE